MMTVERLKQLDGVLRCFGLVRERELEEVLASARDGEMVIVDEPVTPLTISPIPAAHPDFDFPKAMAEVLARRYAGEMPAPDVVVTESSDGH